MKKIVLLGIAALAMAGLPSVAGASGEGDVAGPKCADVVSGDGFYSSTGTVTVNLLLAAPSCPYLTFTTYVLDSSGTTPITSTSVKGDGASSTLTLTVNGVPDQPDSTVCVYATTSVGQHVFDRAPDAGCAPMVQEIPPGFQGFD